MKILIPLISCLLCILNGTTSICQSTNNHVSGTLLTPEGKPIAGATIMMLHGEDGHVLSYTISKLDGSFQLAPIMGPDTILHLKIDHIEYDAWRKSIHISEFLNGQLHLQIQLNLRNQTLKEIMVKAPPLSYRTQNDTTEFRAKAYRTVETRRVEDLLKKIQGFQVSDDGRIFFQGKEIEKLLLDGEDMTDRNYRLLSKNLNASLVERVQVIDNYSDDRLMRSIERSGKIAINLTVDSVYQNMMSGTVGVSTAGKKHLMDLSTVFPGKALKWLTFTNYNQVGIQTGTQLSDDRTGAQRMIDSRSDVSTSPAFEPVQIPSPPLDVRYARDNEDQSAIQVFSRRYKKGQTFRLLTGIGLGRLQRSADMESRLYALTGNDWTLHQQQVYSVKAREALASIHYKHDHHQNHTGALDVHLMQTQHTQSYVEQTSGEFIDSLTEGYRQKRLMMRSKGEETLAMKFGTLLKLTYGLDLEHMNQSQQLSTIRMIPILSTANGLDSFHQLIEMKKAAGQADISMHGRIKHVRWSGGINLAIQRERHELSSGSVFGATGGLRLVPFRDRLIGSKSMVFYGKWQTTIQRKTGLFFNGEFGIAPFDVMDSVRNVISDRQVHRLNVGIDHKLSMLSAIRLNAFNHRKIPTFDWFHTGPILMADGQIRLPASEIVPETTTGVNLSISRLNLPRSFTGLLYFSYVVSDGAYRQVAERKPTFSQTTFMPFDGQRSLFASGSLSKHFPVLKFKSMTDASIQQITGDSRLDQWPIRNEFGRFSIQQRFISAFPIPVNVELSYTANRIFNRLYSEVTGASNIDQWQHIGYVRLNGRVGEKGFFSMIYGHKILMTSSIFNTVDLYGRWKLSKMLFVSVTGHNLTNMRVLAQRTVTLNATTDQRTSLVGRYILLGAEWSF